MHFRMRNQFHHLFRRLFSRQFLLYVFSGGTANALDIGLFYVLTWLGVWYVTASMVGSVVGFFSAFFLQKYVAFDSRGKHMNHFLRFCAMGLFNFLMITVILAFFVEVLGIPKEVAKILANASVVLWNFFIYKFLVYV